MQISRTAAFAALSSRHAGERSAAKRFVVRPLTKAGLVTKAAVTAQDMQLNAFVERADADARLAVLEGLNPGSKYTVVSL